MVNKKRKKMRVKPRDMQKFWRRQGRKGRKGYGTLVMILRRKDRMKQKEKKIL